MTDFTKPMAILTLRTINLTWIRTSFQRNRHNLVYMLGFIGVVIVLGAWNPVYGVPSIQKLYGRVWLVIGIAILYLGFVVRGKGGILPRPFLFTIFRQSIPVRYGFLAFLGGCGLILLGFWANPLYYFAGWRPPVYSQLPNYYQLLLFFGGMALWVIGFMREGDFQRIAQRLRTSLKHYPREWVLVIGLALLALGVRLYKLSSLIPVMISDETAYLAATRHVIEGTPLTIASDMHHGDLYLGAYLISIITYFSGSTLFTGRLLVALVGTLAIPGVYLMGRKILNWQAGLLAALFLLGQPLHMHFSRIAMYDIYDPTFGIFAVLLIWDGMERGGYWKFALAGSLVGFSIYFYAGAKLWGVLIPVWVILIGLRQPRIVLSHWFHFGLVGLSIFLVLFPMIAHFQTYQLDPFGHAETMGRGAETGILNIFNNWTVESFIFDALSPSIRAFVDRGDVTGHFELQGRAALNLRWALLAFAIGVAFYLRYPFNEGLLFLMLWLGLTVVLGGALMESTPGFSRYVTATLPMAVVAGVGTSAFFNNFKEYLSGKYQRLVMFPAIGMLLLVNYQNLHYVYENLPQNWRTNMAVVRLINDSIGQDAAQKQQEGKQVFFLLTGNPDRERLLETYTYYCGLCEFNDLNLLRFTTVDRHWITEVWLSTLESDQDLYIYVLPEVDDPYNLSQPFSPKSPVSVIGAAYPDAEITRFNSAKYNTAHKVGLYTRVKIPAGAEYCPVGAACRQAPSRP